MEEEVDEPMINRLFELPTCHIRNFTAKWGKATDGAARGRNKAPTYRVAKHHGGMT